MKHVLIVAYNWPPDAPVGANRPTRRAGSSVRLGIEAPEQSRIGQAH
jgi:hypothetical protein